MLEVKKNLLDFMAVLTQLFFFLTVAINLKLRLNYSFSKNLTERGGD